MKKLLTVYKYIDTDIKGEDKIPSDWFESKEEALTWYETNHVFFKIDRLESELASVEKERNRNKSRLSQLYRTAEMLKKHRAKCDLPARFYIDDQVFYNQYGSKSEKRMFWLQTWLFYKNRNHYLSCQAKYLRERSKSISEGIRKLKEELKNEQSGNTADDSCRGD